MHLLITLNHVLYLLGVQESIHFPISTSVTTNAQSLITAVQHHSMSPSGLIYVVLQS